MMRSRSARRGGFASRDVLNSAVLTAGLLSFQSIVIFRYSVAISYTVLFIVPTKLKENKLEELNR